MRVLAYPLALAPSVVALLALYGAGALAVGPMLLAMAGIAAVTVVLVNRYLHALSVAEQATAAAQQATEVERRRASLDAVAESAQSIVDGLPDPLIAVDRQRRIVRANRAARQLLGAAGPERDLSTTLRHPQLLAAIDGLLQAPDAAAEAPGGAVVELALPGPPELDMVAHLQRLPRAAADGSLALVVLHDTTALRRAERMRADFVANASHELKTPIAGLAGFIETLRGPARDDAAARDRFLAIMAEQAERMRRLVDDLLMLSRIEQHEHARPEGAVDLVPVLKSVLDLLQLKARDREVALQLRLAPGLPRALGDADELTIVFQNLVDNAIKYTRPGTAVKIAAGPAGEGRVAVAVADEGEGIAAAHLPRLTERFYRVDAARSRQLGGTGLGLAIVKHVVNRHRGRLDIQSSPGRGSTFTVLLPVA
ncbi:MAG: PAS domain-containing protein [Proteobacteria bacterium]|nr:PAS domain-containing protein [Pseudomonadota bacterium]